MEDGRPRVVVFGGPAGIGKTRLLAQFADRIEDRGVLALRTSCVELGVEGVPLIPLTDAVRQLVGQFGVDGLAAIVPAARALAEMLPEHQRAGWQEGSAGPRAELFAAVLHRLGIQRPVVWVVDDLHWSDKSSRDALGLLARTLRGTQVLIVIGYRDELSDTHPVSHFLSDLGRLPHVTHSTVEPFSRVEVTELLSALAPADPSAEQVDAVFKRSGGNPFYATELAVAGNSPTLPRSLQALLLGQIDRLGPAAHTVIRTVAIGGTVEHDVLAGTTGLAEQDLTAALRTSVEAHVLEPAGTGYTMRHALLREAVIANLLPVERARLHRASAAALQSITDPDPTGQRAAVLALHWVHAGDPDRALPVLITAAAAAGGVHAYAEQAQLLDRALRIWPQVPDAQTLTGTALPALYEAATAPATWAGEYLQVLDLVDRGQDAPEVAADPYRVALLLAHRAMAMHHLNRKGALQAVDAALRVVPTEPGEQRLRVLDYLAAVLTLRGQPHRARELAEESRRIATALADRMLSVKASTTLGWVLSELGEYRDSLAVLEEARAATVDPSDSVQHTRLWLNLAVALHGLGRYADAIEAARSGLGSKRLSGLDRTMGLGLIVVMSPALIALGRLEEAESVTARGLSRDPAPSIAAQLHIDRAEIGLLWADAATAHHELHAARLAVGHEAAAPGWELPLIRQAVAVALHDGEIKTAQDAVDRGLRVQRAAPHDAWAFLVTAAYAVTHPATTRADPTATGARLRRLREHADRLPNDTPAVAAYARQFDAETGEDDAWLDAAAAWDGLGHLVNAAYCRMRAARAVLATDRDTARELLGAAADGASKAGATALLGEIQALARGAHLELAGASPDRASDGRLGLTARELEVLGMVADGSSNKQIATALFISPKTVSVHVSNILGKLGVASRAEAAALAHRSGLVD